MQAAAARLADGGCEFTYDGEERAMLVRRIDGGAAIFKLYVVDDEEWRPQLLFRDYVREHADARREYEAVKRDAIAENPDDVGEYARDKTATVESIVERAREAGYEERLPDFA